MPQNMAFRLLCTNTYKSVLCFRYILDLHTVPCVQILRVEVLNQGGLF